MLETCSGIINADVNLASSQDISRNGNVKLNRLWPMYTTDSHSDTMTNNAAQELSWGLKLSIYTYF